MDVSRRRLRVLHVITDLDLGGAETMLAALVTARADTGLEQVVASLLPRGALTPRLRNAGVDVHEFAFKSVSAPVELLKLASLIRRFSPDVVQGWMYHGDLAALLALTVSGRRNQTALAWGVRCSDMDLGRYGGQLRLVVRTCACMSSKPDVVTANSKSGLEWHRQLGYAPHRAMVMPNGIDVERFQPNGAARNAVRMELGLEADTFLLAHVARVDPMKDHGTFLAAMGRLPGVRALLIGAGTETLPETQGTIRLGRRDDVPRLLAASDAIVSTSSFGEGFCNALAEGMACGLPAIATDVGDARTILGDTGWIVPPREPAALIEAISALKVEGFTRRGHAARQRIVERFSLASAQSRYVQLYRELAARKAGTTTDLSVAKPT